MPDDPRLIYWDANCFVSYIEGDTTRVPVLRALLDEAANNKGQLAIVTSIISRVEVAYAASERDAQALSADVERRIDELGADDAVVRVVEVHPLIVQGARDLIRSSVPRGWTGLKGNDAIHLATARFMKVAEVHTYEARGVWKRYEPEVGCPIAEPRTDRPYIPGLLGST